MRPGLLSVAIVATGLAAAVPSAAAASSPNVRVALATPFAARIVWTTTTPTRGFVMYGGASTYGLWTARTRARREHSLWLTGLHWATRYHFRVVSGGAKSADATFTTPALDPSRHTTSVDSAKRILLDGHPFFPVLQWLQCPTLFDVNVALGVDTFMGAGCDGVGTAQELRETELRAALSIFPFDAGVAGAPSLAGWRFPDEPDLHGIPPADLRKERARIRAADPSHITFLTLSEGFYSRVGPPAWMHGSRTHYRRYASAADVVGFDFYPVYAWCHPEWISGEADATRELAERYAPRKPVYSWIEAAATSGESCAGRGPLANEVREVAWMVTTYVEKANGNFLHTWNSWYSQFVVARSW